ncbi:MAG: ankyrin repeat domain-containing protein [Candidatus Sericytochromatia bacterium]
MYNYSNHYLMERFERAISNNQIDIIKEILSNNKIFLNSHNKEGLYPIHIAVKNNSIEVLDLLLSLGDDINIKTKYIYSSDYSELTSLELSCKENNFEMVKYLIEKGANLHISKYGTLLYSSINNIEISKYLIERGVNIETQYNSAVFYAIYEKAFDFIKLIFELKVPFKAYNNNNNSLLMESCRNGNYEIVKFLIEKGFDVNKENYYSESPIINACYSGNLDIIILLIENGANYILKRSIYNYCKHSLSITKFFLEKGVPLTRDIIYSYYEKYNYSYKEVIFYLIENNFINPNTLFNCYFSIKDISIISSIQDNIFSIEIINNNIQKIISS